MHTLTLSDGSTTLDLAVTSATAGIHLLSFVPPAGDRKATRVGPGVGVAGQRTIMSVLPDVDASITVRITDTTANAIEARYIALIRLLELARNWEENRTGSPVRLAWSRQGVANTAYWTVTGVPQLPRPTGKQGWLDRETLTNRLDLTFVLTLEPVAHAATPDILINRVGITTTPGSNIVTAAVATHGDVAGPASVAVGRTSTGNDWNTVWIAQIVGTPDTIDYSGTVDAAAYGGQGQTQTYSGTVLGFTGSGIAISANQQHPIRGFLRMKAITAPTAGIAAIQIRMRVNFGTSTGSQWTGEWLPFAGTLGNYTLIDMGAIPVMSNLQNRSGTPTSSYFVTVEMQSTDATGFQVRADFSTYLAAYGITKLTGIALANTDQVIYEATSSSNGDTYYAPRQDVQTYETNTLTNVLQTNATRAGRLTRHPGGATVSYWVQGQSTGLHQITDAATVYVEHLPCYALGFRGAA